MKVTRPDQIKVGQIWKWTGDRTLLHIKCPAKKLIEVVSEYNYNYQSVSGKILNLKPEVIVTMTWFGIQYGYWKFIKNQKTKCEICYEFQLNHRKIK